MHQLPCYIRISLPTAGSCASTYTLTRTSDFDIADDRPKLPSPSGMSQHVQRGMTERYSTSKPANDEQTGYKQEPSTLSSTA